MICGFVIANDSAWLKFNGFIMEAENKGAADDEVDIGNNITSLEDGFLDSHFFDC